MNEKTKEAMDKDWLHVMNVPGESKENDMKGKLRIWWVTNVPNKPFHCFVEDGYEAKSILNLLADYNLHLGELIQSNAGGLQVFEDGEWIEWEDEQGNNIY